MTSLVLNQSVALPVDEPQTGIKAVSQDMPMSLGLDLKNTVTPRVFIAATRQDDGKTTTSIGLFAALRARYGNIGYIKPVGQRYVVVEGMKIDEDTVLVLSLIHI